MEGCTNAAGGKKKNHTRTKNAIQEIEAATRFLEHTTKIHIHPHLVHCWKRRAEPNGYTTRSAYLLMQGEATEENSDQNLMDTQLSKQHYLHSKP